MNIRSFLSRFLTSAVPSAQVTVHHLTGVPQAVSHDMTADRIHGILRASEAGQWDDYLSLVRDITSGDANILADFTQRKTRLLSKPWSCRVSIPDPRAARNEAFCTGQLKQITGLIPALSHLLDSCIWPVSVLEKIYAPGTAGERYKLAGLVPVPYHLLDFRAGVLAIKETQPDGMPTGQVTPLDPVRYVVHRGHLLQSLPDCWGGPARALLFWWFIGASARSWWTQGAERNSVPFLVGKYDSANPADRGALLSAFRAAARTFGLAISRETEVEVHKDMGSGDAGVHQRLLEFAQSQMSRLVVGQTMTTKAQAGGLGSNQADIQDAVLTDIVQFDATLLGATLRDQLLAPLLHLNGFDGPVPDLGWQVTSDDAAAVAGVLATLKNAGIGLDADGIDQLSDIVGLPVVVESSPLSPAPATLKAPALLPSDADALAHAFRGTLAPVRRIIRDSTSPDDLTAKLAAFYPDFSASRLAVLTEGALVAASAGATKGFPV